MVSREFLQDWVVWLVVCVLLVWIGFNAGIGVVGKFFLIAGFLWTAWPFLFIVHEKREKRKKRRRR